MFSPDFQRWSAAVYGASFEWALREQYLVRIMGSFVFVLGTLSILAARRPLENKLIILSMIEFFLLRNFHRHYYSAELQSAFGVSSQINTATSLVFFTLAAVLGVSLFLCARSKRSEG